MRRVSSIFFLTGLLAIGGCSLPIKTASPGPVMKEQEIVKDTAPLAKKPGQAAASRNPAAEPKTVRSPAKDVLPHKESLTSHRPDAIIKLDLHAGEILPQMEGRLVAIAEKTKSDEQIRIRLESYVPDGGSPSLNLALAESNLQKVKESLVELGIPPRRILLSNFGEEHPEAADRHQCWVEIYLLGPT